MEQKKGQNNRKALSVEQYLCKRREIRSVEQMKEDQKELVSQTLRLQQNSLHISNYLGC